MPLLVFELVNVCRKPVEGNLRLREQRDLYSRHNFEDVSNHVADSERYLFAGFECFIF